MANLIEIVITAVDNASAQIKGVAASTTALGSSFGGLAAALGGPVGIASAMGVAGVAAAGLANKFSDQVEQLRNMSARTGASINDLRALRQIMIEAGQSPEVLTTALTIANRNLAMHAKELATVGITARTPMEALLQLSDIIDRTGNSSKTTAAAFMLLGRGGGELIPIMGGLRGEMRDMHDRLGDISASTLEAAKSWDRMVDHFKTSVKGLMDQVIGPILQGLEKTLILIQDVGSAMVALSHLDFAKAIMNAAHGIGVYSGQILTPPPGGLGGGGAGGGGGSVSPGSGWQLLADALISGTGVTGPRNILKSRPVIEIDAKVKGKPPEVWISDLTRTMTDFTQNAASIIAGNFANMFDSIFVYGENVLSSLKRMLMDIANQIASTALRLGLSLGLTALGGAIGMPFLGKIGDALGGASQQRAGTQVFIQTLDTRTLRMQMQMPHGAWARAQGELRLGTVY